MGIVAQQAVTMMKKVIPYCDGNELDDTMILCEHLQMMTPGYNDISLNILPTIKLHLQELQLIYSSLHTGSPNIEAIKLHFKSRNFSRGHKIICANRLSKLQEVAPNYVQRHSQKD